MLGTNRTDEIGTRHWNEHFNYTHNSCTHLSKQGIHFYQLCFDMDAYFSENRAYKNRKPQILDIFPFVAMSALNSTLRFKRKADMSK
jgi:hypothetical protein